jgi:hypothetical protein
MTVLVWRCEIRESYAYTDQKLKQYEILKNFAVKILENRFVFTVVCYYNLIGQSDQFLNVDWLLRLFFRRLYFNTVLFSAILTGKLHEVYKSCSIYGTNSWQLS